MATSNFFYILVWAIEHLKIGFVHGLPVPLVSVNITAQHPNGTFNHGDPNILCTPTSWTTFLTFFLGNYVAHAATVVTAPGQQTMETAFALIMALLYPGSGLVRGLDAVFRASSLGKSPLEQAARAGAFCMVVRSRTWEPESKQRFQAYYELGKATQRVCTQVLNEKTTVIERETNHTQKNVSGPEGCVPSNIEVKDMPHTSHLELDRNTTSPRTVDRTDVR
ncbi:hypothetical protein MMC17_008649 [Xylographa soralifera]|nr:hypothetical protein [Xylographa soralifera]